jgi:Na+/alanine symporter
MKITTTILLFVFTTIVVITIATTANADFVAATKKNRDTVRC